MPTSSPSSGVLAVLDVPGLQEQTEDDAELLAQLVESFRQEANLQLQALLLAHQRGRAEEVRRLAHRLRGSLAYLHAPAAQRAAAHVEQHPGSAELVELERHLGELMVALEELVPRPCGRMHRDG